jgi:hypothetical protein
MWQDVLLLRFCLAILWALGRFLGRGAWLRQCETGYIYRLGRRLKHV